MSDDETSLRVLRGQVLEPENPLNKGLPVTPAPPYHHGVINLWGAMRLHAEKRGHQRYAAMIHAQEEAHLALVNLLRAKEELSRMEARFEPDSIEMIKEHEREKIRQERREDEARIKAHEIDMLGKEYELKAAKAKLEGFEHDQEILRMRREVEKQRLRDQLHGTNEAEKQEESYEAKYAKLTEKLKKHHDEYATACETNPTMSQAEKDRWRKREMELEEEIENLV